MEDSTHYLLGLLVIIFGSGMIGYIIGFEAGSPINDITEIVWIESHEPIVMTAFNMECRLVPKRED